MRPTSLLPLLLLSLATGCTSSRWDGHVVHSGTLDQAVRPLGVSLMDATRKSSYGLGILEKAGGVAIVIDGQVAIGRALSPTHARTDPGFAPGMGASWMVRAEVSRWREELLAEPVDVAGLARRVRELARSEGWPADRPLLFVVEGAFESLSASIVRGAPPGSEPDSATEPFRTHLRQASGTLVGVHAPGRDGLFVLPGDELRVHALLREPTHLVATVDAVRIQRGATLRVPLR